MDTVLIDSCQWEAWNADGATQGLTDKDINNYHGWISDCGNHLDEIGTRIRTRTCKTEVTGGTDVGGPLCAVNVDDLIETADKTVKCVGSSEILTQDGQNFFKFCERMIEQEPVYCPCT